MKTIITVEGKKHEAEGFMYGFFDEQNHYHSYVQADIENIEYEDRYQPLIESLEKRIEAYEEQMQYLANEFIEIYNSDKLPFPEVEAAEVQKEHRVLMQKLEGLYEAKRIILTEVEGGEEQ